MEEPDKISRYETLKNNIRIQMNMAFRSFIVIGYLLKQARDTDVLEESGYCDVWTFAFAEFGISRSTASRFMSINDKFSVGGNSSTIDERYKEFSKSKLQEMLYLSDEQIEKVTPETTVAQIREMRQEDEEPEVDDNIPGQMEITDVLGGTQEEPEELCDIAQEEELEDDSKNETEITKTEEIISENQKNVTKSEKNDIKTEENVAENSKSEKSAAVTEIGIPLLRNNDARKEWIRNYKTWNIWFTVPLADETYYRYDFDNGAAVVMRVTKAWCPWKKHYGQSCESQYEQLYLIEPGYHYLHDCMINENGVVDYIKQMQKKG